MKNKFVNFIFLEKKNEIMSGFKQITNILSKESTLSTICGGIGGLFSYYEIRKRKAYFLESGSHGEITYFLTYAGATLFFGLLSSSSPTIVPIWGTIILLERMKN